MRDLPPALAASLASGATTLCWCWRITPRIGPPLGFTDHDRDLTFDGTTFEAASGFTATEIRESVGRNHHIESSTMWLAGGGVKPGLNLGATDELGFSSVEDKMHVHDLHATVLHLLGFDHTKLTFKFQGRDFRLTDVHGEVVKKLLA